MEEPRPAILSYADASTRPRRPIFSRSGKIALAIILGAILILFAIIAGPGTGDIRFDSGDLRYFWLGIPLQYERTPEPLRSKLLKLAAMPPAVPAQWVNCVTYPLQGSNNPDRMCRQFYKDIEIWIDEDPALARILMNDVAAYIRRSPMEGLPESFELLSYPHFHNGSVAGWRDDPDIQYFCTTHGYIAPAPTTTPAK